MSFKLVIASILSVCALGWALFQNAPSSNHVIYVITLQRQVQCAYIVPVIDGGMYCQDKDHMVTAFYSAQQVIQIYTTPS